MKHLNEHSTLYGGQMLEWIDNFCFAKTERYKKNKEEKFVTRNINCDFIQPVFLGDTIRLAITNEKVGNTSVSFEFNVSSEERLVVKGTTTFVKLVKEMKAKIE